jgi:hypothetical protein
MQASTPSRCLRHSAVGCFLIPPALLLLLLLGSGQAWGWGGTGHRIINKNAVRHLPPAMLELSAQQQFLEDHASDADYRKSPPDTAEYPKHFLDLESYSDYPHLTPSLPSLISQYGWTTVRANGILPWATLWAFDSLTAQFRRHDLVKAYQTAADLGHYVGDAHNPLHCTINYDGYLTGNNGIHSRYETGMISLVQGSITVSVDTVRYIPEPYTFIFNSILRSRELVDSIILADNAAKSASGWNGSSSAPQTYYTALWERTQRFTMALFQEATTDLASLWYTAWVNAGATTQVAAGDPGLLPGQFVLEQNFPNPFNPSTSIRYALPRETRVHLEVFNALGERVAQLVHEEQVRGEHQVTFDARGLASGVYFCRLWTTEAVQTRRMMLVR